MPKKLVSIFALVRNNSRILAIILFSFDAVPVSATSSRLTGPGILRDRNDGSSASIADMILFRYKNTLLRRLLLA